MYSAGLGLQSVRVSEPSRWGGGGQESSGMRPVAREASVHCIPGPGNKQEDRASTPRWGGWQEIESAFLRLRGEDRAASPCRGDVVLAGGG